ncbi:hypothetical protein Pfo_007340 [Paulownia fortunei]|nr:hypothetical protein Pfo_007340 [Paulownia fortunei]
MKQNFHSAALLLFLVFLISTPHTSARKLAAKEANVKINSSSSSSSKKSVVKMESIDSFSLMGLEEYCQNEDEECLKRRVFAEAHLDYIYTQHHKP